MTLASQNILQLLNVNDKNFITGQVLKQMFLKAHEIFIENVELINSINVFPVPDGDTGLNMVETLRAIRESLEELNEKPTCGEVIRKISLGAFNGSAGNSGIIFSEYLHGLENEWANLEFLNAQTLKLGFESASKSAYSSIDHPREGTILTVQRRIAEYFNQNATDDNNPFVLMVNAFIEAKRTLIETHFLLSDANKAKTIDAGALAFVIIFEGFISAVFDEEIFSIVTSKTIDEELKPFLTVDMEKLVLVEQEWEVQFYINSIKKSIQMIKDSLKKEGECLIITYDHETPDFKVHIHIKKPVNEFLQKIKSLFGEIKNVRILDLKSQNEEFIQTLYNK